MSFTWRRYSPHAGYEVSSKGDKRFSALFAVLPDGRTIEEAYQLDVKGYRKHSPNWRYGKGLPSILTPKEKLPEAYLALWREWASANPGLMDELDELAGYCGAILTDQFATSPVNQAWALSTLLNERRACQSASAPPASSTAYDPGPWKP